MIWIYILQCTDNIYYVGQTKRLYTRFWEHDGHKGGINTTIYTPLQIVAIYKAENIIKFIEYNNYVKNILCGTWHNEYKSNKLYFFNNERKISSYEVLDAENNIAECMMLHNENNWEDIRGGKYVRFDCNYKFPNNEYIKELPLCNCGLPCDIKKHKTKEYLYFRCAKKNMYDKFKQQFNIEDEPCKFYKEYLTDVELRVMIKKKYSTDFGKLIKNSSWLKNIPGEDDDTVPQCVYCDIYVWCDSQGIFKDNGINYNNERKLLCKQCFKNNNEDLKKRYNIFNNGKCHISL